MGKDIVFKLRPIHFLCSLVLFFLLTYIMGKHEIYKEDADIMRSDYNLKALDENFFYDKIHTGRVAVLFYQDDTPIFNKMEAYLEVIGSNNPSDSFFKIRITSNSSLIMNYNLSGTPVILLFNNGKEVGKIMGYVPLSNLEMIYNRVK